MMEQQASWTFRG